MYAQAPSARPGKDGGKCRLEDEAGRGVWQRGSLDANVDALGASMQELYMYMYIYLSIYIYIEVCIYAYIYVNMYIQPKLV